MILPLRLRSSEEFLRGYGVEIDTSLYPFLQFRWALIGCILYLISDLLFQPSKSEEALNKQRDLKNRNNKKENISFKLFMFGHNFALCLFSVLCFINTVSYPFKLYNYDSNGWFHFACKNGWKQMV